MIAADDLQRFQPVPVPAVFLGLVEQVICLFDEPVGGQ
jgi:hypothetical protein